jgi:hypothetical protein
MSNRYAVIENGLVTNVALWDGVTEWDGSTSTVLLPADSPVGPGYTYDGTTFTAPPSPPSPTP